jgi:hypothetical protein
LIFPTSTMRATSEGCRKCGSPVPTPRFAYT